MWRLASFSVVREHEKCDTFPAAAGLRSGASPLCFYNCCGWFLLCRNSTVWNTHACLSFGMLQLCCSVAALVSKKRGGSREWRGLRWCGVRWCREGREARVEGVGWVGGGGQEWVDAEGGLQRVREQILWGKGGDGKRKCEIPWKIDGEKSIQTEMRKRIVLYPERKYFCFLNSFAFISARCYSL